MKSMRMALLAAAALAVTPAAAWADRQNQPDQGDHGGHGDHGDRGNRGGGDHPRPAPPQGGGHGPAMMVMPGSTPNGYHAPPPQMPQPPAQPQDRGGWRGPGSQGRGDVRVDGPRPIPAPYADTGQARAQWRQGDHGGDRGGNWQNNPANGDHRWDNNNRGQWNGGDRRPDDNNTHQWDNGRNHWDNGDHRPNGDDHRWDGRPNPGGPRDGNHGWNGRPGGNDHRWDPGRWRNDHRYDWRDWRNSHRNVFSRHYYAPRGYHYRPVYAGFFLEPFFYSSGYWLGDPYDDYRLPPVEWPLRWVHYYNDALLVDVTTGEVVDVIPNFFY